MLLWYVFYLAETEIIVEVPNNSNSYFWRLYKLSFSMHILQFWLIVINKTILGTNPSLTNIAFFV